jgi:hypothetical protein
MFSNLWGFNQAFTLRNIRNSISPIDVKARGSIKTTMA